jgi:hypothetical protein
MCCSYPYAHCFLLLWTLISLSEATRQTECARAQSCAENMCFFQRTAGCGKLRGDIGDCNFAKFGRIKWKILINPEMQLSWETQKLMLEKRDGGRRIIRKSIDCVNVLKWRSKSKKIVIFYNIYLATYDYVKAMNTQNGFDVWCTVYDEYEINPSFSTYIHNLFLFRRVSA